MVPRTVGRLEAAGRHTFLEIGADDHEWIARYLASLPVTFEVIEPPELTEAVKSLGRRLLDR